MQRHRMVEETGSRPGLIRTALGSLALGAGAMYILDPERGRRRRHMARDKALSVFSDMGSAARKTAEYAGGRMRGVVAETTARLRSEQVTDRQLCERVRSAMGRAVSHPGTIEVTAQNGIVTLSGPILAAEVDNLLSTARGVRGVKGVESRLEVYNQPGDLPALQGGSSRMGRRYAIMQEYWAPSTRLLAGTVGLTILSWGIGRRGLIGSITSLGGIGLLLRSLTNLPAKRLTGIGAGRKAIDVQKTINIAAPVEQVFEFFSRFDNFPRFMSQVREVRLHEAGRSHWVVAGPAGMNVEWDADVTQFEPNRALAWKSAKGSMVENAGVIRFQPGDQGGTRVDIKLSYNPPAGALGHAVATLFGADPKSEMDEDLMRVKTLIETGHPPRDAARPVESEQKA